MPSPYNLKRAVEDGIEAVLKKQGGRWLTGYSIFKGLSGLEITGPRIEIIAARMEAIIHGSYTLGEVNVSVSCGVISHYADTTRAAHAEVEGQIFNVWWSNDMADWINTLITVQGFKATLWTPIAAEDQVNADREYKTEFTGEMRCINKNVV